MPRFASHIKEAILINKERRRYYASVSMSRTRSLSNTLIGLEYLAIPIAWYFDTCAIRFNKKGFRIILDDFVPMHVKPANNIIPQSKPLTKIISSEVNKRICVYIKLLKKKPNLNQVTTESEKLYNWLKHREGENQVYFAMSLHLLESVLLIAKNGTEYCEASDGKTMRLTWQLIKLHLFALRFSLIIDKKANLFHQEGIGIVVNDLPNIKFN